MKYWSFFANSLEDGAVLSTVPADGPKANKYRKGKSLKAGYPGIDDAVMCFDPNYEERLKLYNILDCLDGVVVIHEKVKELFEAGGINEEFLNVRIWDHLNRPVSDDYYIFN